MLQVGYRHAARCEPSPQQASPLFASNGKRLRKPPLIAENIAEV
jgi:hypothetical protein